MYCYIYLCTALHMTTTSIRKLVATSTEIAAEKGFITPEQRQSVHNLSGHSIRTVQKHYLLAQNAAEDRIQDVRNVRGILGTVGTQASSSKLAPLNIDIEKVSVSIRTKSLWLYFLFHIILLYVCNFSFYILPIIIRSWVTVRALISGMLRRPSLTQKRYHGGRSIQRLIASTVSGLYGHQLRCILSALGWKQLLMLAFRSKAY